jgi:hypothetical protein
MAIVLAVTIPLAPVISAYAEAACEAAAAGIKRE